MRNNSKLGIVHGNEGTFSVFIHGRRSQRTTTRRSRIGQMQTKVSCGQPCGRTQTSADEAYRWNTQCIYGARNMVSGKRFRLEKLLKNCMSKLPKKQELWNKRSQHSLISKRVSIYNIFQNCHLSDLGLINATLITCVIIYYSNYYKSCASTKVIKACSVQ